MLLAIEANASGGSVALFDGGRLLGERSVVMKGATEERLMPAVVDLVTAHTHWGELTALVVSGGPGSFTSLRIAAAIAKGIATATGAPLYAAPSLGLLVAQASAPPSGRYAAVLDAMRGEVFLALVDVGSGGRVSAIGDAARVSASDVASIAASEGATLVGAIEGAVHAWAPHARGAGVLVAQRLVTVVDLASWEPDYGRLAEAQVKWEAVHGRSLAGGGGAGPAGA
ncbi:MAG: tRNA (adenosine(37)-N6)-threonylcarbamoyltransferase complex dimerization subunit type 1 TsaB [Gemmatimonadaceae bacterium]|nr:tRNA (adenosine(37)-N6)-threonylcarbamoyltransferase complex dimerization subunit type 1 TsaB [Gemmatimonadaceae bacterium]